MYTRDFWPILGLLQHTGLRVAGALFSTFLLSFTCGKWFVGLSKRFFRAQSRPHTPDTHRVKDDTPTMGGILILATVLINTLLWCDFTQPNVWILLLCLLGFGAVGAWDDAGKIRSRHGMSALTKFVLQSAIALLVTGLWLYVGGGSTELMLPYVQRCMIDLGMLFFAWALLVIVGSSNAVNLTDGLDGLAVGSLIPNFALFAGISYMFGTLYMQMSELAVIAASIMGACFGFLWYNTHPAQIFMGDVGSLALGAGLGCLALMAKSELLLVVSGGVFVVETLSVMAQVISFKLRGKRLFKMAPIHHHFELVGWHESTITMRFTIISLMLSLLAFVALYYSRV